MKIRGNYDDVNRLCTELSGERDWAFVNVNLRPYYAEGSKTIAWEVAEQLGWKTPDRIVAPVASGSLYTKIGKGFSEWLDLGIISGDVPVMHGAQAAGCSPVAQAFEAGTTSAVRSSRTRSPSRWRSGTRRMVPTRSSWRARAGGTIEAVTDDEVREGIRLLAETTGIFTETAGGVTTASLAKLAERGEIGAGESVVLVITGEGLKTLDAVRGTFEEHEIDASFDAFVSEVERRVVHA